MNKLIIQNNKCNLGLKLGTENYNEDTCRPAAKASSVFVVTVINHSASEPPGILYKLRTELIKYSINLSQIFKAGDYSKINILVSLCGFQ
jgi:hypothetical protein